MSADGEASATGSSQAERGGGPSVILTTYEQPRALELVLWGYANQTLSDLEIIVADDGSGPETGRVIDRVREEAALTIRRVWHEDRGFRKTESEWSPKTYKGVPFHFTNPQDGAVANVVMLHGPNGKVSAKMPKSVRLTCNGPARAIHLLSGISGWGYPYSKEKSVTMIVRLHYADGKTEEHPLLNGVHFADYIGKAHVPQSELAFMARSQQVRYLAVYPKRTEAIADIEFVKGPDRTAPVVMAVTVESP